MNWNWISNVHWTNGIKHWLCFIQNMEFKTNVCWKVYVHKTCCLLVSLKTLKVLPFVELEKGSFAKWKLINNGHFVGRFCLIPVYLTSLLYFFYSSSFPRFITTDVFIFLRLRTNSLFFSLLSFQEGGFHCLIACVEMSIFSGFRGVLSPCLNLWDKRHSKNQNALHIFSSVWLEISRVACEMIVSFHIWCLTSLTTVLSYIRRTVWI